MASSLIAEFDAGTRKSKENKLVIVIFAATEGA
jgi:hypothetical protein